MVREVKSLVSKALSLLRLWGKVCFFTFSQVLEAASFLVSGNSHLHCLSLHHKDSAFLVTAPSLTPSYKDPHDYITI